MMQPGQKKLLGQPIQLKAAILDHTAFGGPVPGRATLGTGLEAHRGALHTLFGADQTFSGTSSGDGIPSLAALATDILLIGAKIRETADLGDPEALRRLLTACFLDFDRACRAHGKPAEEAEQCKYALAAFLDESVIDGGNDCREAWISEPLQTRLFNDHLAGENFFKRLEVLLGDLNLHQETVEVFYLCLALGFQGRYRLAGPETLSKVVRNLLLKLESIRGTPPEALSPCAYVHPGPSGRSRAGTPLLIVSSALLVLAVALYGGLMAFSGRTLDPARQALETLEAIGDGPEAP